MPDSEKGLPKYLQIAGHIRDQIVRGDLKPGQDVPSEREIAGAWGVARPTAARALESLRMQGLVESRQGAGTFVRQPQAVPRARERYARASERGTMYSATESVEFLATTLVAGPEHVIEALQLPARSSVIRRSRLLRGASGHPIELSTSWFAPTFVDDAPLLLKPHRISGGTARYVGQVTGRVPSYVRDQVAARFATAEECEILELPEPSPVLTYRLAVYDTTDAPLQFDDATCPPGHWAFHQEYRIDV